MCIRDRTYTVASVNGTGDVYITKHDVNGNFAWVNRFGGYDSDEVGKIVVEPNGDHCITGSYRLLPTLNSSTTGITDFVAGTGQRIAFVLRFDASGGLTYSRNLAGPGSNFGRALNITPTGEIYIGGRFIQNSGFNLTNGTLPPLLTVGGATTNTNGFLAKYFNCPSYTMAVSGATVCSGETFSLTTNNSGFASYLWQGPSSYQSSLQLSLIHI